MLINLIVVLIVIGVALYLIKLIPMDETIRTIIVVLVILAVVLHLLKMLNVVL